MMDKELLHSYLDGELNAEEVAAVEAEVARVPALRAELDALRGVDAALALVEGHDAPDGFTERVVAATRTGRGRLLRIALPLAAAAALALAVFLPRGGSSSGIGEAISAEDIGYAWETDVETYGSLSMRDLESQILEELEAA